MMRVIKMIRLRKNLLLKLKFNPLRNLNLNQMVKNLKIINILNNKMINYLKINHDIVSKFHSYIIFTKKYSCLNIYIHIQKYLIQNYLKVLLLFADNFSSFWT